MTSLDLFQSLPDMAPSRRLSPATSHAAAASVRDLTARHRAVYEALRRLGPSADFEIEAGYDRFSGEAWWTPQTGQSLRSRRAMLAHRYYELVVTAGHRRPSPNGGHPALVWAAVDPVRAAALFDRMADE